MCLAICIGLISFAVINSSFVALRDEYVKLSVDAHLQSINRDIEEHGRASVIQTAMIARMPAVIRAYEIALGGDINDPLSLQSQTAREVLRREFAPALKNYEEMVGQKPRIHFHLPNGRSLVRLWREKNTRVNGGWLDISDDISKYRHMVMKVNKTGKPVYGLEAGSSGIAIRGVIPIKAYDGRILGSVEILQDFDSLLVASESATMAISLYANRNLLEFSVGLQELMDADTSDKRLKGHFLRVGKAHDFENMISSELLLRGKTESFMENHGPVVFAVNPLLDYSKNQIGVMVCAMNTVAIYKFVNIAGIILGIMLAGMVLSSSVSLVYGSRKMVLGPIGEIKARILDIVEDRADLSERLPGLQKDEIGDLARLFNTLIAKVSIMLDDLREAIRKNTETEGLLAQEKEFFRVTLDSIGDAVITMDRDGVVTTINSAAKAISGFTELQAVGRYFYDTFILLDGKTHERAKCPIKKSISENMPPVSSDAYLLRTGDGLKKNISFNCSPIKSADGVASGAVLVFRDISELKKQTAEMEYLSYHDSLTGLYNRAFFEHACKSLQNEEIVTIIMGDANGLKHANDVHGHEAGDILLQTIANAFKSACRSNDIIARWGGDEFVAILPGLSRDRAKMIVKNIHRFCEESSTGPVKASVALGIATKETPNTLLTDVMKVAERRMYLLKYLSNLPK